MIVIPVIAVILSQAAEPPARFESFKDGYRVTLTRAAAERFQATLDKIGDEKSLAAALRELAKVERAKDEESETAAKLEVVAIVLAGQIPQLKKSLADNIGPSGVTIRVYGLQRENVLKTPRPRLKRIFEGVKATLPDETRATIDGVMTAARTTPLTWRVEPRK